MYNRSTREPLLSSMVTEDVGMTAVKVLCIECGHENTVIVLREGLPYSAAFAKMKTEVIFKQHLCKIRMEMVGSGW